MGPVTSACQKLIVALRDDDEVMVAAAATAVMAVVVGHDWGARHEREAIDLERVFDVQDDASVTPEVGGQLFATARAVAKRALANA